MSDRNGSFGDFMTGFLMGALAGGIVALLKAPQSGEETREQIRARGLELRDTAEQRLDETMTTVRSTARDVGNRAEELRGEWQTVLQEAQKQWAQAIVEIRQAAMEAVEEIREAAGEAAKETGKMTAQAAKDTGRAASEIAKGA